MPHIKIDRKSGGILLAVVCGVWASVNTGILMSAYPLPDTMTAAPSSEWLKTIGPAVGSVLLTLMSFWPASNAKEQWIKTLLTLLAQLLSAGIGWIGSVDITLNSRDPKRKSATYHFDVPDAVTSADSANIKPA